MGYRVYVFCVTGGKQLFLWATGGQVLYEYLVRMWIGEER